MVVFMEMSLWVESAQLTKGGCAVISPSLLQTAGVPSLKLPNTNPVPNNECNCQVHAQSLFKKNLNENILLEPVKLWRTSLLLLVVMPVCSVVQ